MKHFNIEEFAESATARRMNIDNTIPDDALANIYRLVDVTLDPAREQYDAPIYVNSGYRCPALNRAVGGAKNSYHLQGRAADLDTRSRRGNCKLLKILQNLPHVELINENNFQWIHVAL